MVTYWLLFSYLVPISLFVTIEIVKFIQVPCLLKYSKLVAALCEYANLGRNGAAAPWASNLLAVNFSRSLCIGSLAVLSVQGNFINNDPQMRPPGTIDWAKVTIVKYSSHTGIMSSTLLINTGASTCHVGHKVLSHKVLALCGIVLLLC